MLLTNVTSNERIIRFVAESFGQQLIKAELQRGVLVDATTDQAYAETTFEYYPSNHLNKGLLKAMMGPLYNASSPTLHKMISLPGSAW